jgi:hypothetical protein
MQPQPPRKSAKAPASRKPPLEKRRFPLSSQTEGTTNREKVRETVAQVRAPRQTLRPVERTSKKK